MRKPAHLQMNGGKSPRQRIWEAIRQLRAFTLEQLRGELPGTIHRDTIKTYLGCLENGGYVSRMILDGLPGYSLQQDAGVEAPRLRDDGTPVTQGLAQEQMWRTLKMLGGEHTAKQLAASASTPEVEVTEAAAVDYLAWLAKAGYLVRTGTGKRTAKYRLIPAKYSGPRPPMIQRVKQVYDPNLDRVVWTRQEGADGRA
jgi:hypothetical protein